MTERTMTDEQFFRILAEAARQGRDRILSSDEEFEKFLQENPLTPEEEKRVEEAINQIKMRLWSRSLANTPPRKDCNRHDDCATADKRYRDNNNGDHPPVGFHCHDESCEDCFGS